MDEVLQQNYAIFVFSFLKCFPTFLSKCMMKESNYTYINYFKNVNLQIRA